MPRNVCIESFKVLYMLDSIVHQQRSWYPHYNKLNQDLKHIRTGYQALLQNTFSNSYPAES